MQITINTKDDSHEDIRNVIRMLQHLVGDHSVTTQPNIFDGSKPTVGSDGDVFSNFFGSQETKDNEEKEDIPKIIEY